MNGPGESNPFGNTAEPLLSCKDFFNQPADGSNPMLQYRSAMQCLHAQKLRQILKNYVDSSTLLIVRTSLGLFTAYF